MDFIPPKISEVISGLQELLEKHGDLPVCLMDNDTGWLMPIWARYNSQYELEESDGLEIITIESSYAYGSNDIFTIH